MTSQSKRPVGVEPHLVGTPYVVRKINDHGLVCMAVVGSIQTLWDIADDIMDPPGCEFSMLTELVVEWPTIAPIFPLEWNADREAYRTDEPGWAPLSLTRATLLEVGTERSTQGHKGFRWLPLDTSYVYAAKSGDRIKIGFTTNIDQRMKQLNRQSAYPVTLVAKMRGDYLAEEALLRKFAHLRANGEWLDIGANDEQAIIRQFENDHV